MIPQHIYDAIIESSAGKFLNHQIMDELYETIVTAQKKYRRDRQKQSRQSMLNKYHSIAQEQNRHE